MNLFEELKRRNVFRVAVAYVVLSWLLLQAGDLLFDLMGLPEWALRIVLGIVVLGFVPALVISWVYELTPEGLRRDTGAQSSSAQHTTGRRLDLITIAAVMVGLLMVGMDRWVFDRPDVAATDGPATAMEETEVDASESPSVTADPSIAVLPFVNLSSDPDQEYFSDGLADTVLHRLAQVKGLRVAARTSSFKFKGRNEDMREIAQQLGVATVLEGTVQRQGDRVRITAQLIAGADGSHLWSKVFDDTLDDIFRVQDDIAHSVAEALTASLPGESEATTGEQGGTENLAAYEAYLKGIDAMDRGTPEAANEALAQLELAVGLDPNYARAWAALSRAHAGPATLGTATWESTYGPRMEAAERAITLAPDLAQAHLALAGALAIQGRSHEVVRESVERAIAVEPNNAEALSMMAGVRSRDGEIRESLRLAERAVLVSPMDPGLKMDLAYRRVAAGLVDSAVELAEAVVTEDPGNLDRLMDYGDLLRASFRRAEAVRVFEQALDRNPDLLRALFRLTWLHLDLGDEETADSYLRRVEVLSPNRALDDRAEFCLLNGDRDCHRDYVQRYLVLQRASGAEAAAQIFEARLMVLEGRFEEAVALLEPRVNEQLVDNTVAVGMDARLFLAIAYGRSGRTADRDRLLDSAENDVRHALANGLWTRYGVRPLLELAAIRDDPRLATERLKLAIDSESAPSSNDLLNYAAYQGVRDDPGFRAQVERLQQWEASELERIRAAIR